MLSGNKTWPQVVFHPVEFGTRVYPYTPAEGRKLTGHDAGLEPYQSTRLSRYNAGR